MLHGHWYLRDLPALRPTEDGSITSLHDALSIMQGRLTEKTYSRAQSELHFRGSATHQRMTPGWSGRPPQPPGVPGGQAWPHAREPCLQTVPVAEGASHSDPVLLPWQAVEELERVRLWVARNVEDNCAFHYRQTLLARMAALSPSSQPGQEGEGGGIGVDKTGVARIAALSPSSQSGQEGEGGRMGVDGAGVGSGASREEDPQPRSDMGEAPGGGKEQVHLASILKVSRVKRVCVRSVKGNVVNVGRLRRVCMRNVKGLARCAVWVLHYCSDEAWHMSESFFFWWMCACLAASGPRNAAALGVCGVHRHDALRFFTCCFAEGSEAVASLAFLWLFPRGCLLLRCRMSGTGPCSCWLVTHLGRYDMTWHRELTVLRFARNSNH